MVNRQRNVTHPQPILLKQRHGEVRDELWNTLSGSSLAVPRGVQVILMQGCSVPSTIHVLVHLLRHLLSVAKIHSGDSNPGKQTAKFVINITRSILQHNSEPYTFFIFNLNLKCHLVNFCCVWAVFVKYLLHHNHNVVHFDALQGTVVTVKQKEIKSAMKTKCTCFILKKMCTHYM